MSYYLIEDFRHGLDLRKSVFTSPPGSLRRVINANITAGGEIEKAKAWSVFATLPEGVTHGLHSVRDQLYVFGSGETPENLPANVQYQRLQAADVSAVLERILDTEVFNSKLYVVAEFDNGAVHHFYDGARVTDWDTISENASDNDTVAQALAQRLSQESPLITSASGTTVTVTGADFNAPLTLTSEVQGTAQTLTATEVQIPTLAQPSVWTVDVGGTFAGNSIFVITVSYEAPGGTIEFTVKLQGRSVGMGRSCVTFGDKMYSVAQSLLYYSGFTGAPPVPDPTGWDPATATGAGFINMATQSGGSSDLVGVGKYQNSMAVFSRRDTQIWTIDPDPDKNSRFQVLDGIGAVANRSIQSFGDVDLFFLSDTGVRSLRARDSSNIASAQDVGSPIDPEIRELLVQDPLLSRSTAIVDPSTGRYLLALGDKVYAFSHFPGSKISAWSTYVGLGTFTDFAVAGNRLYGRSGDIVYLMGGASGSDYNTGDLQTEVWIPFMDAESPATQKTFLGLDIGCEGDWEIFLHPNPAAPEMYEYVGSVSGTTFGFQPRFAIGGQGTHFSLRLVHQGSEYARLANVVVHYRTGEAG
jgi:hypothetical protein